MSTGVNPVVSSVVRYALTQSNVDTANYRRQVRGRATDTDVPVPIGHGGPLVVGQLVPLIVTVTLSNGAVNGQALLDGDDSLWIEGALRGTGPGTWQ